MPASDFCFVFHHFKPVHPKGILVGVNVKKLYYFIVTYFV